jgi:hypothetical protein
MENTLVSELRSITAAALTAMSAAERSSWIEAEKCVADLDTRIRHVHRQIAFTNNELRGHGEPPSCLRDGT